jgi:hypothetical protein
VSLHLLFGPGRQLFDRASDHNGPTMYDT